MTNLGPRVNSKKLIWRMNAANPGAGRPRQQSARTNIFLNTAKQHAHYGISRIVANFHGSYALPCAWADRGIRKQKTKRKNGDLSCKKIN
jgi:hypothetical protein